MPMEIGGFGLEVLAVSFVGVLVALWGLFWLAGNDAQEAAEKTSDRIVGVTTGVVGGVVALAAGLLQGFLMEPGIIITILGLGSIFGGFSAEAFLAGAVLTYVLKAAVGGGVRARRA